MTDNHWLARSAETDSGVRLAVLADDVTGACDAGAQFSRTGAATRVHLRIPQTNPGHGRVSVLVTHTRNALPEEASEKVRRAYDEVAASGAELCYKKIDSTLKGNIGAELRAIEDKSPDRLILLCPSLPKMHRTVVDGRLEVRQDGKSESIDLLSLLTSQGVLNLSHISQSTGKGQGPTLLEQIQHAEADGARIIVIDATTESHLQAIAEAGLEIAPRPLLVGSAGLARPWSELLTKLACHGGSGATEQASHAPFMPSAAVDTAGPVVFCIGSTNPVTCRQTTHLAATLKVQSFQCGGDDLRQAQAAVALGCHLTISLQAGATNLDDLRCLLVGVLETDNVRGLVCSGGDTARLVCSSLEVEAIQLITEVLPGLPWGVLVGGPACGLPICTKAGGFGSIESLCRAADFLATKPPFRWRPQ